MNRLIERCAMLDVHKSQITACVRVPDGRGGRRQEICEFRFVFFSESRDDSFLAREVAINKPHAHARFRADVVHRGLMEPTAREAYYRSGKDLRATVGNGIRGRRHGIAK